VKIQHSKKPLYFLALGSVQYIILTTIAMFFYPGGSNSDPKGGPYTAGYTFFENYFSDLGREIAINGISNMIASKLYLIATLVYGLSLIPFFLTIPQEFSDDSHGKKYVKQASIFGIIAGLGTILYAIAPLDTMGAFHSVGVVFGYIGTFTAILMLGKAIQKREKSIIIEGKLLVYCGIILYVTLIIALIFNDIVIIVMIMQKLGKYLSMLIWIVFSVQRKKENYQMD
jgi:hypothetical protein